MGQDDIVGELVAIVAAQRLRQEKEDNIGELLRLVTENLSAGLHGTASTSTPFDSLRQPRSIGAPTRSTDSFLGRVATGSPGCSNASATQGSRPPASSDLATDATSPHSPACSTSQASSPHHYASHIPAPLAETSVPLVGGLLEVNEESFVDPTSITTSDLGCLFKDVVVEQTDDILGGQGSAALGDFEVDLSADMGEQD